MFHVLIHVEIEDLGHFGAVLDERGVTYERVRLYAGEKPPEAIGEGDGLIVLGGPMSVRDRAIYSWIEPELALIKSAMAADRHVLGICLGSQMMAAAQRANVYNAQVKEIGCSAVTLTPAGRVHSLFNDFESEFVVFQWHGETFEIPKGAERIVRGRGVPNQAFLFGKRSVALQFHLEATPTMARSWMKAYPADVAASGLPSADLLLTTVEGNARVLERQARSFMNAFLDL